MQCFSNIISCGKFEQVQYLVEHDVIGALIQQFNGYQESEFVCLILETLSNLLQRGRERAGPVNHFLIQLENKGWVKVIEGLQKHPDTDVYNAVYKFIDELV